jgi:DNA excision repair protein ERCC-4
MFSLLVSSLQSPIADHPLTPRGGLDALTVCIAIDSREQDPLEFTRLQSRVVSLVTGDDTLLACPHAAAIERKSISDLVASVSSDRDRFERELMRMKAYPFRRLVIVGSRAEIEMQRYRSKMSPKAVLHTLSAFEVRYNLPIVYFPDPPAAALQIESWVWWIARQIVLDANALLKGAPCGSNG